VIVGTIRQSMRPRAHRNLIFRTKGNDAHAEVTLDSLGRSKDCLIFYSVLSSAAMQL